MRAARQWQEKALVKLRQGLAAEGHDIESWLLEPQGKDARSTDVNRRGISERAIRIASESGEPTARVAAAYGVCEETMRRAYRRLKLVS